MSKLTIANLPRDESLDREAMSAIRGGTNTWLQGLGPLANVNVGINQNVGQYQNVEVNTLNNIGSIGPGFGPLHLNVAPRQIANVAAVL